MQEPSTEKLAQSLVDIRKQIDTNQVYQHHKTKGLYRIIAVALQEQTLETCIVYESTSGPSLTWVRNYRSWNSLIELNSEFVPRFQPVDIDITP